MNLKEGVFITVGSRIFFQNSGMTGKRKKPENKNVLLSGYACHTHFYRPFLITTPIRRRIGESRHPASYYPLFKLLIIITILFI
jgi:hypothetical protein